MFVESTNEKWGVPNKISKLPAWRSLDLSSTGEIWSHEISDPVVQALSFPGERGVQQVGVLTSEGQGSSAALPVCPAPACYHGWPRQWSWQGGWHDAWPCGGSKKIAGCQLPLAGRTRKCCGWCDYPARQHPGVQGMNQIKRQPEQKECSQSQGESVLKIIICKSSILISFVLPWRIL